MSQRPFALAAALVACAADPAAAVAPRPAPPHQVVIISFDGARDIPQWERSRALAAATGARFTYFLSCVYLLTRQTRGEYTAPGKAAGRSNVGFADSIADVAARLSEIWSARAEGHEIASHACGHFDGKAWTETQWKKEFAAFTRIVGDAYTINALPGEPEGWRHFAQTEVTGFRAPYLSVGDGLTSALKTSGFLYSASGVSRGPAQPGHDGALTTFALPQIPEGPDGRRVIGMDYNLFVRHSGGFERKDTGGVFEERTLAAFRNAFDRQYRGGRVPLQLGFHFTLMNDGAYWRALERFAKDVCLRADVDCISYADYLGRHATIDATKVGDVGG